MPLPEIQEIVSSRVSLRPVRAEDLPDLLEVNGDPEVTRFLPYATWQNLADAEAWLERMNGIVATGTARQLVVVRNQDAKVIGTVLLFRHDEGSARAELGYVVGRAHWRQGYALEALMATLRHAFGALGLRRLEAEVNEANVASNALLLSIGFVPEGLLRERWIDKGQPVSMNIFGMLARDWQHLQDHG